MRVSFPVIAECWLCDVVWGSRQTFRRRRCRSRGILGFLELPHLLMGGDPCVMVILCDVSLYLTRHTHRVIVGEHAGFSEQGQERICALSPLLSFAAESKAASQGQLQQETELPITRQSLQGKSISIPASDTTDPSGSRTRPEDLRARRSIPDDSCASSRPG